MSEVQNEDQDITLEKYQDMLDGHDWYYDYSDDIRTWRHGNNFRARLIKIANAKGGAFKDAWNAACEKRNFQSLKM